MRNSDSSVLEPVETVGGPRAGTNSGSARAVAVAKRWWWVPLATVFAVVFPLTNDAFLVREATLGMVFACAIMGVNLLTGYTGLISLGHGAFMALGAYTVAILADQGMLVGTLVAVALTFVVGFLVGFPALRVHGVYLAIITLSIAIATPPLIKKFPDLTGGSQGLLAELEGPKSTFGLAPDQFEFFLVLVCMVGVFLFTYALTRGRTGRALAAVRDNELVARSIGVNLALLKTTVFALSAAFCGLAGALYTMIIGFVSPESFGLILSVNIFAAMVIGGRATIVGPLIGAAFLIYVPIFANDVNSSLGGFVYGSALVITVLLLPGGIASLPRRVRARWSGSRAPQGVSRSNVANDA